MTKGWIHEIKHMFYPENGGGMFGKRTTLVRLQGCNFFTDEHSPCSFCDHEGAWKPSHFDFPIRNLLNPEENSPNLRNPISVEELVKVIDGLKTPDLYSVYFTGGEPLYQPDFLLSLAETLREKDYRLSIQTNGFLVENARLVAKHFAVAIVDVKDRSAKVTTKKEEYESLVDREISTIEIFKQAGARTDAKIIVTPNSSLDDIRWLGKKLTPLHVDVVWQPVYPAGEFKQGISLRMMNLVPIALAEGGLPPERICRSMPVRAKPMYPLAGESVE